MVSPLDAEHDDVADPAGEELNLGLTAGGVTPKYGKE